MIPISRLRLALEQLIFARRYTLGLLDDLDPANWFRQPAEGVTHLAWQVGHRAMAEYRLALERIRGARPEDERPIAEDFLRPFARQSVPDADPRKCPAPAAIRAVFDRVHAQTLLEVETVSEEALDQVLRKPHRVARTKLDSLFWCSQHEMLHAGQIGLLRRLLGKPPPW